MRANTKQNSTNTKSLLKNNSPGVIILQWLTYAFWGLVVLATSLLASNVLSHYMTTDNNDSAAAYAVAAVIVLLPISVICDAFYSKHEPDKKTGAASIIMIIHAVLFALISIGAVVAIAFSLVQLLVGSGDTTATQIALYDGIMVSVLFVAVLLRTLRPSRPTWLRKVFLMFMMVAIGITLIFGAIGPVNGALLTRNDRLIDNNLATIQYSIDSYVTSQNKLPNTLGLLNLNGDAKKIVDDSLVEYTPNSKPATDYPSTSDSTLAKTKRYYYQLCVDYKEPSADPDIYAPSYSLDTSDTDGYTSYLSTYNHPAGHYCYKLSSTPTFVSNLEKQ